MNLLQETIQILADHGKTPDDVQWCAVKDRYFSWGDFARLADRDYDNDYGTHEVNENLVVVGDDWWLSRGEYDGSEWWNFNRKPEMPTACGLPESLFYRDDD